MPSRVTGIWRGSLEFDRRGLKGDLGDGGVGREVGSSVHELGLLVSMLPNHRI